AEALVRKVHRARSAQPCPFLIAVEQIYHGYIHDVRLDGIERSDQPLGGAGSRAVVLRQQRFAALADVQDDRAAFKEHSSILLDHGHLSEGLKRTVVRFVLIALREQPRPVGQARLLERPAHAQVTHLSLGKRGDPSKGGDCNHGADSWVTVWNCRTSFSRAPTQPCSWLRRVSSLKKPECVNASSA